MKRENMMMEDEAEESDMSKASSPVSDSGNDDSGNDDEMKASSSGSEMDDVDDDDDDVENAIEYEDIDLDAALTEISQTELESEDTELWLFRIPSHLATTEIMVGKEVNINDHDRPINGSNVDAGSYNSGYKFKDCGVEGIEHMRAMFVHGDEHENQRTYLKIAKPFARHISVAFETTLGTIKDEGMKKTYPTPPSGMKLQCHPVGSRGKTAKSGRRRRPRNA